MLLMPAHPERSSACPLPRGVTLDAGENGGGALRLEPGELPGPLL